MITITVLIMMTKSNKEMEEDDVDDEDEFKIFVCLFQSPYYIPHYNFVEHC